MERYGALEAYTTITAPLSGVVIRRYADTGALIGGLAVSVVVTMFLVPAIYLLVHGRREGRTRVAVGEEA
jgi:hypothetical protein